jgi:hypothetical protein
VPKGYRIDQDTVLSKLRQIRHSMKNEHLNVGQALRKAGLSQTTYNRWLKRLGPQLDSPPAAEAQPTTSPTRKAKAQAKTVRRGGPRGRGRPNGDGPTGPQPLALTAYRRPRQQRENQTLREIIADQAILIHQLQNGTRN